MKKKLPKRPKIRSRDLGLQKHARYLKHIDQGPLARRLGQVIKETREAIGMAPELLAKHVGGTEKWLRDVESGRCMPSQEAARRFTSVLWGKTTWQDTPYKRALGSAIDAGFSVRITFYDEPFLARWNDFAAATGCTVSAVARYALERLFDDEPTLVTIKEGIKQGERLRAASILEACPEYVTLLRGDPLAARLVHLAPRVDWKRIADRDGYKLGSDILLSSDDRDDGPASAIEDITRTGPA